MAIAYDSSNSGTNGSSPTTIDVALTCTGSNRLLVVGVSWGTGNAYQITAITYHGVAMTQFGSTMNNAGNTYTAFYYLVAPDTGGSYNVSVTWEGSCRVVNVGAVSFTGVDQTRPFLTTTTSDTENSVDITDSIVTISDSSWVVDVLGDSWSSSTNKGLQTHTPGADQTERVDTGSTYNFGTWLGYAINMTHEGPETKGGTTEMSETISTTATTISALHIVAEVRDATASPVIQVYDSSAITESVSGLVTPPAFIKWDSPTVTESRTVSVRNKLINVYDSPTVTDIVGRYEDDMSVSDSVGVSLAGKSSVDVHDNPFVTDTSEKQIVDTWGFDKDTGSILLGGSSTSENNAYAQSFKGDGGTLKEVQFEIYTEDSPTGYAYAKIYSYSSGLPDSLLATSDAFDISTVGGSPTISTFIFSGINKITLVNGTDYFVAIDVYTISGSSGGLVDVEYDDSPGEHPGVSAQQYLGNWTAIGSSADITFIVYKDEGGNRVSINTFFRSISVYDQATVSELDPPTVTVSGGGGPAAAQINVYDSPTVSELTPPTVTISGGVSPAQINVYDSPTVTDAVTDVRVNPLRPEVYDSPTVTDVVVQVKVNPLKIDAPYDSPTVTDVVVQVKVNPLKIDSVYDSPTVTDVVVQVKVNPLKIDSVYDTPTVTDNVTNGQDVTIKPKQISVYDSSVITELDPPTVIITGGGAPLSINVSELPTVTDVVVNVLVKPLKITVYDSPTVTDQVVDIVIKPLKITVSDDPVATDAVVQVLVKPLKIGVYDDATVSEYSNVNVGGAVAAVKQQSCSQWSWPI